MNTFIPKIDEDCCDPKDCPVYNTEWMTCNITDNKCPKHWFGEDYEDHFDFPDDCPAKKGVLIKREET